MNVLASPPWKALLTRMSMPPSSAAARSASVDAGVGVGDVADAPAGRDGRAPRPPRPRPRASTRVRPPSTMSAPSRGERQRDVAAHARADARHDRDLAFEQHRVPPRRRVASWRSVRPSRRDDLGAERARSGRAARRPSATAAAPAPGRRRARANLPQHVGELLGRPGEARTRRPSRARRRRSARRGRRVERVVAAGARSARAR